ncbi:MAG TPA: VOC family protein [Mycobacteriales bacterium]|nr:VOC family protein [Mycobacteriales bacterium]
MPPVKQVQVTFDCADPERLARFWCEVLGYVDTGSSCVDPAGVGPRLYFQKVPEGKVVKNRVHLDVRVGTGLVGDERVAALETECARLVELGAVRQHLLVADEENESCLVMQDIEGNEFCLD